MRGVQRSREPRVHRHLRDHLSDDPRLDAQPERGRDVHSELARVPEHGQRRDRAQGALLEGESWPGVHLAEYDFVGQGEELSAVSGRRVYARALVTFVPEQASGLPLPLGDLVRAHQVLAARSRATSRTASAIGVMRAVNAGSFLSTTNCRLWQIATARP